MSDDEADASPGQPINTTALLGQAYSRLGHQIVSGVVEAGFPQRPAHSGVFAHIDREGTRLTLLAERANMTPQAMKDLVDDLVRLGYVERRPDPSDGRAKLVTLTEQGRACIDASVEVIAGIERRLDALLGQERLGTLQEALLEILRRG